MAKKAPPTPWDLWDYELALCYRLWRSMPEAPSLKKDPTRRALWDTYCQTSFRQQAKTLHNKRPLEDRIKPFPKDPEDVLREEETEE